MTQILRKQVDANNDVRIFLSRDIDYVDFNPAGYRTPTSPVGKWGANDQTYDQDFMQRLRDYIIELSNLEQPDPNEPMHMWKHLQQDHQVFLEQLRNNNLQSAFDTLNNLYQSPIMNGISQGVWDTVPIKKDSDVAKYRLLRHYDTLLGVCEYLGVIGIQNREQGFSPVVLPVNDLVTGLAQKLATTIPDFHAPRWQGGIWGMDTPYGIMTDRDISALYVALKINSKFTTDSKIVEIGGGVGYVAYWLYQLGFRDITLIDLPAVSVAQAFQLGTNIGKQNVRLPFETYDAPIKFLTPEQFYDSDEMVDLVYNTDSMPEMPNDALKKYLTTIAKVSNSFYSVNHECRSGFNGVPQKSVSLEINTNFIGEIINLERNRYWLRDGYAEEFYVTQNWS
jgi:hypothetical protein